MLLDTSGLLCFHHRAEAHHVEAVQFFRSAPLRLTHNYVLAEYVALARIRRLPRQAVLSFVHDLQDNTAVQVIYVTESLHRAALLTLLLCCSPTQRNRVRLQPRRSSVHLLPVRFRHESRGPRLRRKRLR